MTDRPLHKNDPDRVGSWQIQTRLGIGATAAVFRAVGPLGQAGALKLLRADAASDPCYRARFRAEIRALSSIDSPHVVGLLDADMDGVQPYHVAELIDGPDLRERLTVSGPLQGEELLDFAHGLAEAIADVHRAGFLHRDLKPENVIIGPNGPVLVDFGLASPYDSTEMTQVGGTVGTPGWIAPELIVGRDAGLASDVFVWAALVAYASSGQAPFGEGAAVAMMYRIVHDEPTLDTLNPIVEPAVRPGLIKDPEARPSLDELRCLLDAPAVLDTGLVTAA